MTVSDTQLDRAVASRLAWRELAEGIKRAVAEFDPHAFATNYEFRFDGGAGYAPTENERAMIEDALSGAMSEISEKIAALTQPRT